MAALVHQLPRKHPVGTTQQGNTLQLCAHEGFQLCRVCGASTMCWCVHVVLAPRCSAETPAAEELVRTTSCQLAKGTTECVAYSRRFKQPAVVRQATPSTKLLVSLPRTRSSTMLDSTALGTLRSITGDPATTSMPYATARPRAGCNCSPGPEQLSCQLELRKRSGPDRDSPKWHSSDAFGSL